MSNTTEALNIKKLIQDNNYDEALSETKKALDVALRELGDNHPDLVQYLDLLAEIHKANGNPRGAKKIYKKALRLWMNAFLPKDNYSYFLADLFPMFFKPQALQPRFKPDKIIALRPELLIHSGSKREAYIHPQDPNLCIKVDRLWRRGYRISPRKRLKRLLMPWLIDFWSNREEARVYRSVALKIGEEFFEHAPRCYGIVMTNLGPGLVVERVSDEDGSFSQPIDVYVKNNPGKLKHALDLLEDLYDFLIKHDLVIYDWANPSNFLVRKNSIRGDKIVVVDWKTEGTADKDLPWRDIFPALARKKMTFEYNCLRENIARLASMD